MNLLDNGLHLLYKMPPPPAKTYHGLINQGATCYLNSVLQVLFMTEDFREAVKRHTCDNPGTEFIDLHLKSLFDDLQRYDTYTYNITKKLCIDNVHEQRDAAEYFEKILGLTSSEASQIFHGQSTQKTTCSCSNETDSDGPFWYLTLALLNSYTRHYSVVDGIEEYFSASYFSGENQMYCDECDAKCDATMKCVIKHHPEVLMLLLKRFEFDYRYMTYVKNNCTVDVPYTLQIPENQTYELYAVVDHFGDLRSGHYTATIKAQDDERWYNFNDRWVTPLGNQSFQEDNFEKSSSAYLLFYRKKKVHPADTCTQDTREMSSPGGFPPATSGIYIDQCQDAAKRKQEVEWAEKQRDKDKDRDEGGRKERRGTASTKYPDRDAGRRDSERLDHVKQNMYEDQEGTQEVSQDDFKPVSVDKQEDGGLLTINDLYNDGIQGSGVGKKKQNTPKEDQRSKRGSGSRFYQSPEQPRVEERDVKGDEQQKRGHDEHAHRKGASERQEQDQNRRSESVTTQRDVGAEKRAKGGNEHSQRRADSYLRQAGLAGSSIVTENRGDGSVEKSQPSRARTQDTREMSSPGGFPPATSGIYNDQCQDAVKRKQEVVWAATAGNESAVDFSIHTNEETEMKDIVAFGSKGVGLSSDLHKEDQDNGGYSRQSNHQVCKEERNDFSYHAEKQRDKDKMMTGDEEDKRGNAQADNQTERRASLSGETQQEESVDDPDDVSVRTGDVRHRRPQEGEGMRNTTRKQEVSNMQPQQVCVDMQKDEDKMVMSVNRDQGGRKERRGTASTKYPDREAERWDGERLDVKQKILYFNRKSRKTADQTSESD